MGIFYDLVSKSPLFNPTMALGYSDSEIKKIARLYDIKISNMLYDYLSDIGRCNGGTLAVHDVYIRFYQSTSVHGHLSSDIEIEEELAEAGFQYLTQQKPFLIASVFDSNEIFLTTDSEMPDQLFCWNTSYGMCRNANMTLYEFVKYWSFEHGFVNEFMSEQLKAKTRRYRVGELIDFDKEWPQKGSKIVEL